MSDKSPEMPKPVLSIKTKEGKPATNVYILKAGEHFPGFGGSRHGLTVGKTPSLITRSYAGGGISDTEYDVHDPGVWAWIARLINEGPSLAIMAAGPEGAEG
jgi:hypothetical protein